MNGRVSISNGDIFYSPNSSRDLVLPQGIAENALWNAPPSGAQDFQDPRWWASSTEWLSFVPRSPVAYGGGLFEPLAHIPKEKVQFAPPYGYILSGDILPLWLSIEDTLNNVTTSLCNANDLLPKLPSLPRQFGFDKAHETEEKATTAIAESRDWFSLWIGLLYWAMHKTASPGDEVEGKRAPPGWLAKLTKIYHNQLVLGGLLTEPLLKKHTAADYVGVVLRFPDGQLPQPPAAWFTTLGIPIWYRWGAREAEAAESQTNFSFPAPQISQLQEATTFLASCNHFSPSKTQSSQVNQPTDESTDPLLTRDRSAKAILQKFFRKREVKARPRVRQLQAELEEGEMTEILPVDSASVYVWDWDPEDPTIFMRMLVPRDGREQTLAKYASYQKRYDAIRKEWDCCRLWDPTADETGVKEKETSNHDRDLLSVDFTPDGAAETAIFNLLRLRYGFVPPLPFPETLTIENNSARNQGILVHVLGLARTPSSSLLLQKPLFQICAQFLQKFVAKQPQKPKDDEWDLSPSNRHFMASCNRLKNVRRVTKKGDSSVQMYMFDFGSEATVPWKLAVYSSSTVLYICRLKEEMRERDIALALVQSGFSFRTFQEADTFLEVPETRSWVDSTPLPILARGNSPSVSDWHKYEEQRRLVLEHPRCAQAALRRGGFAWRVARDMVDIDGALAGPSGRYANTDFNFWVLDDRGVEYLDDNLTNMELNVILGQYLILQDQGAWQTRRIWSDGREPFSPGWWTERAEKFYETRVESNLQHEEFLEQHAQRFHAYDRQERTALKCLETWSKEFLTEQLGLPSQLE